MTNVLIIEDEAKAGRELANMLADIDDDIRVLAQLDSIEQTVQWFGSGQRPDLIFSDIQLADGLSFDIFRQINTLTPVIFCTAFDEYLMRAFDTNAVSYLLKPVTREKLEKALEKYHSLRAAVEKTARNPVADLLQQLKLNYKTTLLVHQKEKIIPVNIKDIAFIYLDKTTIMVCTMSNQKYYLTGSLDEIEKTIDPASFFRANRQFLLNRAAIVSAEHFFARKLVAKLKIDTPEKIIVSKAKASEFLQWLEGR